MQTTMATSRNHGGVAIFLVILILLLGIGGAAYYYYNIESEKNYADETVTLATTTSQAVLQLNDSSSVEDVQRVQKLINTYVSRSDSVPSASQTWNEQITVVKDKIAERKSLADEMQARVSSFDSNSSTAELEAFEAELKEFTRALDSQARNQLLGAWSQRKKSILAEMRSVSATIIAKTFPSGAKTYLDGEYIGESSLGIQNVRKGKHRILFEKAGYLPAELEILVEESGTLEPEIVELQLATNPISIKVSGGQKKSKISISIEKTADGNRDIILYIDEKEGREVSFPEAPLGLLNISVTADLRLVSEQTYENVSGEEQVIEIEL